MKLFNVVAIIVLMGASRLSSYGQNSTTDVSPSAEPRFPRNAIYLELGGSGIFYSVNYEYRLSEQVGLRAGFSTWTLNDFIFTPSISFTGVPLMADYLVGGGGSYFEAGAGIAIASLKIDESDGFFGTVTGEKKTVVLGVGTVGYRLQPPGGGVLFRIGFVPLVSQNGSRLSAEISLGATF